MMKKFYILVFCLIFVVLISAKSQTLKNINKYSGVNKKDLKKIYKSNNSKYGKAYKFLLNNASFNDLAVLNNKYLRENVKYAFKTRTIPYTKLYNEKIFKHFVLPYRISQEPLQFWRKKFYKKLHPLIKECKSIEEAAIKVNLWVTEKMKFNRTSRRDQGPLTTIKRGRGRCEEIMILYIAAARSVGIPARPASVPFWGFQNNNHAWVEIWTPEGWKYLGEAKNSLNNTWFSKPTRRAGLITSMALGDYNFENILKSYENSTYINSTNFYTETQDCNIKVVDESMKKIKNAIIHFYVPTFGGLFEVLELKSDKKGNANLELGTSSFFIIANKNNKLGYAVLDTNQTTEKKIVLQRNKKLDSNFVMRFKLPVENIDKSKNKNLIDNFGYKKELAKLRRYKRINEAIKTKKILKYYDSIYFNGKNNDYYKKREEFIDKVNKLAENSDDFLKVFKEFKGNNLKTKILLEILKKWNIKDLIEIPNHRRIMEIVNVFADIKNNFKISDMKYYRNIIAKPQEINFVQNGWQKNFYKEIKNLKDRNISKTVKNIKEYIMNNTNIDKEYKRGYFSSPLNPMDILNMKNISTSYRTKLISACYRYIGIPVKWTGQLEYYDGEKWIANKKSRKPEKKEKKTMLISIYKDGRQIKAVPWENFLIASLKKDGKLSYIFFEGKSIGKKYKAKYLKRDNPIYVESFTRNDNGDANVIIKSIENNTNNAVSISLNTPKIKYKEKNNWEKESLARVKNIIGDVSQSTIVYIRGKEKNEPEIRMTNQILNNINRFSDYNFIIYSVSRNGDDIRDSFDYGFINFKNGDKVLKSNLGWNNYPVVMIFDKDKNLIFSSLGYQMGIVDMILNNLEQN